MPVQVCTPFGPDGEHHIITIGSGTEYYVDNLTMHVRGDSGNVAVFAPHTWIYVRVVKDEPQRAEREQEVWAAARGADIGQGRR